MARQFSEERATLSQRHSSSCRGDLHYLPKSQMSKSDCCSSCRVLSDAFADQFHSCLLILLVLSPPHTTSHHRHHKYQLAQNMSELYQSCVFTAVKTNMSLKTDIHCLLSFLSSLSFNSLFISCPSSIMLNFTFTCYLLLLLCLLLCSSSPCQTQ